MPVASKLLKKSLNVCCWPIQKRINPRRWILYSGPPWNPWLIGLFTGSTLCFGPLHWNGHCSLSRTAFTRCIIPSGLDASSASRRQPDCWLAAHPEFRSFFRGERGYRDFTNVVATGLFATKSNAFEVGRVTPCAPRSLIRGRRAGDCPPYQLHLSRLTALARYGTASFQQSQQPLSHSSALRDRRQSQARRLSWENASGILPPSLQLCRPMAADYSSVQARAYG